MTEETKDFASLFEAKMGAMSTTIQTGKKVTGRIIQITDKTTFVEVIVEPRANVYPMQPGGQPVEGMIFG